MKKLVALLTSFAVLFGSQAAAGTYKGEEAVGLILEAHEEGLILEEKVSKVEIVIRMVLDRRYYECILRTYYQNCYDLTGIDGKYEE